MKHPRKRCGLALATMLVLVLALVPAALAETMSQDQEVSITIIEEGVLWISVDEHIHFGDWYPGETADKHNFSANYTNTLPGDDSWSATVTATDFIRYEWVHPEGEDEGWHVPTDDTIPYQQLTIFPGYNQWATEMGVSFGPTATFSGDGDVSDPVTLFTAPGEFKGGFHTPGNDDGDDLAAWLEVNVPVETETGDDWRADYYATLTYTLTG